MTTRTVVLVISIAFVQQACSGKANHTAAESTTPGSQLDMSHLPPMVERSLSILHLPILFDAPEGYDFDETSRGLTFAGDDGIGVALDMSTAPVPCGRAKKREGATLSEKVTSHGYLATWIEDKGGGEKRFHVEACFAAGRYPTLWCRIENEKSDAVAAIGVAMCGSLRADPRGEDVLDQEYEEPEDEEDVVLSLQPIGLELEITAPPGAVARKNEAALPADDNTRNVPMEIVWEGGHGILVQRLNGDKCKPDVALELVAEDDVLVRDIRADGFAVAVKYDRGETSAAVCSEPLGVLCLGLMLADGDWGPEAVEICKSIRPVARP